MSQPLLVLMSDAHAAYAVTKAGTQKQCFQLNTSPQYNVGENSQSGNDELVKHNEMYDGLNMRKKMIRMHYTFYMLKQINELTVNLTRQEHWSKI